jgi:hypothetical protein
MTAPSIKVAILHPRERAESFDTRFGALCDALTDGGMRVDAAAYHDDVADEIEARLCRVQVVLVWQNPIEGGRTRRVLDDVLNRVVAHGVIVSAHPDTIRRMGTKDVLVDVHDVPFGSDCYRVDSLQQLEEELPKRLLHGPRVLKQHRGHSGIGVWRIEQLGQDRFTLQHAVRGSGAEEGPLKRLLDCLAPYFADGGHMVDRFWRRRGSSCCATASASRPSACRCSGMQTFYSAAHRGPTTSATCCVRST